MTFELRDYQLETLTNIYNSLAKGHKSIVVQSPPRTGKTVVMAEIARRATDKGNKVLFVVHRKEIVDQVKKTFAENDVDFNLCKVCMVQSAKKLKFKPNIILVDEAHHALAKTYVDLLDKNPQSVKLLFTATPVRLNGQGFDSVATDLIQGKQIQWLIDNGFLADFDYYAPSQIKTIDLKVKRTGEFDEKSIEQALKPKIYGNVVHEYKKLSLGKQAIAYTYNVASAEHLADTFNRNGITAKAVTGKTPKAKRDAIVEAYRRGKIQVVTNAELFTEGIDLPNVDTVIMLRPTQSLALFLQFAMRSMNPREGKKALIIDHVQNVMRFGLPSDDREWSLYGSKKKSKSTSTTTKPSPTVCDNCFATFIKTDKTCPYCGYDLSNSPRELQRVEEAKLEKLDKSPIKDRVKKILHDPEIMAVAGKLPSELKTIAELKAYRKYKGYNPRWVSYMKKLYHIYK